MNYHKHAHFLLYLIPLFPALLVTAPSATLAAAVEVHDSPLIEELDFYQYQDNSGVIHFVDSLDKIPARYRDKIIVRKETYSARQTTKVSIIDNQIHLPVTFRSGDRSVQGVFLLDTGASMTVITEEFAGLLNLDLTKSLLSTSRLADGSEVEVSLVTADSVAVGQREKAPLQIGIMRHKGQRELHDGLLGFDFLRNFQYQLDIANELIRWQ